MATAVDLALAWVLETISVVYVGRGGWRQAQPALEEAAELFQQIGASRRWEQSAGLLGEIRYLQGKYTEAQAIQKGTLASARQRGDTQFQFHELTGFAMNATRLGNLTQATELLRRSHTFLGENNDLVEEIRFYGLSAQVYLQQGDMVSAKESAQHAAECIAKVRPTAFYNLEGYAGVSEVYLAALENEKNAEDLKSARRAVKSLHEFGKILWIGRPRAWLHQGLLDWAEGRQKKAFQAWEKSLGLAEQMSLPYEAARAHYEIGRHMEVNSPVRRIHLETAVEMFSQMGVRCDLEKAQKVLTE